jgi:hypothetical protein
MTRVELQFALQRATNSTLDGYSIGRHAPSAASMAI